MSEPKPEALIVEHGGRSYIRISTARNYGWYDRDRVAANGAHPLQTAPGDDGFLMFEGRVERLEQITGPRRIITKYELREDLRGAAKAEVLGVDAWRDLSDADQGLYTPVHEDIPQLAEPIPFRTQVEGGEPSKLPQGVISIDPYYFARFPSFWHLGPVRATAKYVLWRTAKRLREVAKGNRYIEFSWFRNEKEMDELLTSQHRDSFFIKATNFTVNGTEVAPKNFHTMFTTDAKERSLSYSRVVSAIDAQNLEELEAKVSAYVEELTKQARTWAAPDRCPCCQRRFKATPSRALSRGEG